MSGAPGASAVARSMRCCCSIAAQKRRADHRAQLEGRRCRSPALARRARQSLRGRSPSTPKGASAIDWGVYGAPETFLVDADGIGALQARRADDDRRLGEEFLPRISAAQDRGGWPNECGTSCSASRCWCCSAAPRSRSTPSVAFDGPGAQARYERLIRELRCLVCRNETIADSNAPLAADLRREVREMIAAGQERRRRSSSS